MELVGKYVIVRSRNEGVNSGYVVSHDEKSITLRDARRLWTHRPAKGSWYEGCAVYGLDPRSKLSVAVPLKHIVEEYSITVCSDEAAASIRAHPEHVSEG